MERETIRIQFKNSVCSSGSKENIRESGLIQSDAEARTGQFSSGSLNQHWRTGKEGDSQLFLRKLKLKAARNNAIEKLNFSQT